MAHFQFILEAHDGAVMTVRMNQSPAIELMTRIRRDVFEKEFTEQEGLASQPLSIQVVRKKIGEFIPKDGATAWFQNDYGQARLNLRNILRL